jgi:predicted metal-dependent enzyme (double-stranded beta helix superfamily)
MFDKDQFIADCRDALQGDRPSFNVRDVVSRAISDRAAICRQLGEPKAGGIQPLIRSPELTIINLCWPSNIVVMPHNHAMWAVIGVYDGREDNILWRRLPRGGSGKIEAAGAKALSTGDVQVFGTDVIHSVINPSQRVTGAIHVYGGDFFGVERSEWDADSLEERPFDMQKVQKLFER